MEIEMERVDVGALLGEVLTTVRPLSGEHSTMVELAEEECGREIMTDPGRIRQVLLNLLSYAVESGGGEPVRVRCQGEPDGGVRIEVVSRGSGDAVAALPRVLNEFIRLDDSVECDSELELCLRLAELLHGTLEVGSMEEAGSTFRLTLPKAPHGA
ncbi:MAG TPA: HAMP domain-containing sensor histidine kinase [Longimicrobiaceae bacterium]|nr:HAMP domain-containing sensor histidine kinase [Longimicrobiaceae bacterium]